MLLEKRKFKRLDIYHIIQIKSDASLLGLIRNFSCQGFSFEMDSIDFDQKENIEFKLVYPETNLSVSFFGDVVWGKWVANTFLAGIKLRKMDKEIKDKLIEILCAIRNIPIDFLNYDKKLEILMRESKEDKCIEKLREKLVFETSVFETSKNSKRKLIRNFVIGLSISFFIISGIIIFKTLRIPVSKTYYQTTPKELDQKERLLQSENILKKTIKEQASSQILDEDALFNKDKETQNIDNKSIIQVRSDKNIDTENKLNGKLNGNNQYASRLVYTVQTFSQERIEDAQKEFNSILQSLNKNDPSFLRIEKVGKYYTVRLGSFEDYETAMKFLHDINHPLSEAIILKAYIKNERIIRLYK
jgi:hypothetical protein